MYFPFIRGKQFELVALRELAPRLPNYLYKPIIEPVRRNLLPLIKTIKHINEFNIQPIVIINPDLGDFDGLNIELYSAILKLDDSLNFLPCIKITDNNNFIDLLNDLPKKRAIFIPEIDDESVLKYIEGECLGILPVDIFDEELAKLKNIILLDDPFQKKSRNADYKEKSRFSSLHKNYNSRQNVIGFGDYTIVGSDYSEAGGPAYVVTIHLSYIEKENEKMFVRHFSSSPSNSPANPGGKFDEALKNVMAFIKSNPNVFDRTFGLDELSRLYANEHFPGLGQVKKISIQHHIETICNYLDI
ncbi:sce7725 family protein [Lonsdalea quercina]|uniref:sce7725 family protein n=1 Tax=Lonsdalea quercina TaxID=71657 RepID=UPI003974B744